MSSKVITIEGQEFTLTVSVGKLLEIESKKMVYTNGQYGAILNAGTKSGYYTLDLTDALAVLTTLAPELVSSKKPITFFKSIFEIDPETAKIIVSVYKKDIKPWLDAIIEACQIADEISNNEAKS